MSPRSLYASVICSGADKGQFWQHLGDIPEQIHTRCKHGETELTRAKKSRNLPYVAYPSSRSYTRKDKINKKKRHKEMTVRKEGPSLKKVTITDDRLDGGDASGASPVPTTRVIVSIF